MVLIQGIIEMSPGLALGILIRMHNHDSFLFLGADAGGLDKLHEQIIDPRTGMLGYSVFIELLKREYLRFLYEGAPFSLMLLTISSSDGSALCPEALICVDLRISASLDTIDAVGQFKGLKSGGGELGILLPGKRATEAVSVAGRLLKVLEASPLAAGLNKRNIAMAFGIAGAPEHCRTLDELYLAARTAQLQAREKVFPVQTYRGRER